MSHANSKRLSAVSRFLAAVVAALVLAARGFGACCRSRHHG